MSDTDSRTWKRTLAQYLASVFPTYLVVENDGLSRQQRDFIQDFEVECPHCGATFEQVGRWLEHSREIFGNE